jgi:ACS family hexuronate transporter-like MFS transporter
MRQTAGLAEPLRKKTPIKNLRWYIGGLLFLSTVINYIDRQTLSLSPPTSRLPTTGTIPTLRF